MFRRSFWEVGVFCYSVRCTNVKNHSVLSSDSYKNWPFVASLILTTSPLWIRFPRNIINASNISSIKGIFNPLKLGNIIAYNQNAKCKHSVDEQNENKNSVVIGILLQSTAWCTGVKQHRPWFVLRWVTVIVCQILLIILRMKLYNALFMLLQRQYEFPFGINIVQFSIRITSASVIISCWHSKLVYAYI